MNTRSASWPPTTRPTTASTTVANPLLWFIQHYLWDLSYAPDIREKDVEDFEQGYKVVNEDLAAAVIEEIDGVGDPIVMVHDYHLYTLPAVVRAFEAELKRRRREHIILRVDRADLSKNVLRGFSAFDQFLEEHPEFVERVTFIAQLMPSRMDVPQYADYLERIETLVALINQRHGTPDWMPIQLKLRDDLEEAVAAYKNYDVMIVNAMFDGMNLVAKEGPLVNECDGVSILSENTGAHEELGEYALSVNPFDIKETADSIFKALTMSPRERARRAEGLKAVVTARDPGDWIDEQLVDIRAKRAEGSNEPAG